MPSATGRLALLLFGLSCYALFLATFAAAIAFLSGAPVAEWLGRAPRAPASGQDTIAAAVDLALLALFAVQHTVMARPAFKRRWTRVVPAAAERSVFVLASSAVLVLLVLEWRPIAGDAWRVEGPAAVALWSLAAGGWALLLVSSFLIDHFELFGVRQVLDAFRSRPHRPAPFRERGPYRLVRHPLMLGFVIAFWACPAMTWDRLLFAAVATAYIALLGLVVEERDLLAAHGAAYADYRRRVPRLLPWPRPRARG